MNKLGTVIHESMEELLAPLKAVDDFVPTESLKAKLQIADQVVLQQIGNEYLTSFNTVDELNSLQRIMHKIATEYVKMYLQYDIDQYEAIRIVELENSDDYILDFPIEINGSIETVSLYGIIDRVDEVLTKDGQTKLRIVDYKTGADSVKFRNLDVVFAANTENKALVQTLFYAYVYEQVTGLRNLEPHLYVARRMREDGTVFKNNTGSFVLSDQTLAEQKDVFVAFLKSTLEELFDQQVPFKHNPEAVVYPSDPFTLFYKYSVKESAEESI